MHISLGTRVPIRLDSVSAATLRRQGCVRIVRHSPRLTALCGSSAPISRSGSHDFPGSAPDAGTVRPPHIEFRGSPPIQSCEPATRFCHLRDARSLGSAHRRSKRGHRRRQSSYSGRDPPRTPASPLERRRSYRISEQRSRNPDGLVAVIAHREEIRIGRLVVGRRVVHETPAAASRRAPVLRSRVRCSSSLQTRESDGRENESGRRGHSRRAVAELK
jgi:hypothetical protein